MTLLRYQIKHMKRTIILATFVFLFLTSTFVCLGQEIVSIYLQPGSPLQLSNLISTPRTMTDNNGREWHMLSVKYVSQNVSDKTIRAYTIQQFEGDLTDKAGATALNYSPSPLGWLKPNQTRNEGFGENSRSTEPQTQSIKLAVDFVEFTDGSTWGRDVSKSAEQIAGMRAGAKASLEHLKKINEENGIEAVIKALDETKDFPVAENQSDVWKRGFKVGINSIKNRVKRAYETEGVKSAETNLQKPFDASP